MRLLVVKVGSSGVDERAGLAADLRSAGASDVDIAVLEQLAEPIDDLLATLDGRRLLIDADVGGVNAVLARLMRRGELDSVETAVLPRAEIGYLSAIGLPGGRADQLRVATSGRPRLVGVVKDDSGGVCVDSAAMRSWQELDPWWVRAVVDDQRLCDGAARQLSLRRIGPSQLEAQVTIGRFRRRSAVGRSLQLACDPAAIVADGIARTQPRSKRTFWSEPALWRLALP